jgi:putative oxidoreductase
MNRHRLDRFRPWSDLIFRSLLSWIFIVGGLGHWMRHDYMMGRLRDSPWYDWIVLIGDPSMLMYVSGATLTIGGLALLLGFVTRIASLILFVTVVPITFVINIAPADVGPLLKNVAILGGLVHFFFHGSGACALDRHLATSIE